MQKVYDCATIKWEDFDWADQDCQLTLEVEYSEREGFSPDPALFDPGEPAELELMAVTVTGALVGPDLREATSEELKSIQTQLRRNPVEMGLIEDYVVRIS